MFKADRGVKLGIYHLDSKLNQDDKCQLNQNAFGSILIRKPCGLSMLPGHLFTGIFFLFYILLYRVVNEWRNKSLFLSLSLYQTQLTTLPEQNVYFVASITRYIIASAVAAQLWAPPKNPFKSPILSFRYELF